MVGFTTPGAVVGATGAAVATGAAAGGAAQFLQTQPLSPLTEPVPLALAVKVQFMVMLRGLQFRKKPS